jgi:hypothetical protein
MVKTKHVGHSIHQNGEKMNTRTQTILAIASRNLRIGGAAVIATAAYIVVARPSNINLFLLPYTGDPLVLGGILVLVGGLVTALGYSLKNK